MKILEINPLCVPVVAEIDGSLSSMQAKVGGIIQAIYPFEDPSVALICCDEGKLVGMPPNRCLRDSDGRVYDIVCGTFFLCAAPPDCDHFTSLSEQQIALYEDYFKRIELFL